ncbi:BTB (POZ) domain containing 3 [Aphelenchoides avenae]|nr:BTB (POZ) domain containing 3 [Aphelenchus avenae]
MSTSVNTSLKARMEWLLKNDKTTDVQFLAGNEQTSQEIVRAHSIILASASDAFCAMFFGEFDKPSVIEVPDASPDTIRVMLKYVYLDKADITLENALPVLYIAKKYLITGLHKATVSYLRSHIKASNICQFLPSLYLFEELTDMCWNLVDAESDNVLHSDDFLALDFETVKQIISRDTLSASEKTIFNRCIEWARAELERSEKQLTSESVRELFGAAFLLIRFSQLQVDEFDDGPRHSGYLTPDEQEHILAWITSGEGPSEFASQPRLGYIAAKGDKNEVVSRPCWSFCEYCEERQDSGDRGRQHSCEGWRRFIYYENLPTIYQCLCERENRSARPSDKCACGIDYFRCCACGRYNKYTPGYCKCQCGSAFFGCACPKLHQYTSDRFACDCNHWIHFP